MVEGTQTKTMKDETVTIEFEWWQHVQYPRLGYGKGYGSYRIADGDVQRVQFQSPHERQLRGDTYPCDGDSTGKKTRREVSFATFGH